MTPRSDILDHNLTQLLQRAYKPALPSEAFRSQLQERVFTKFKTTFGEKCTGSTPVEPSSRLQLGTLTAAAAALLIALILGVSAILSSEPTTSSPDHILARGDIAVAFAGQSWRAATRNEQSFGIDLLTAADVAVPNGTEISVRSANDAVLIKANSRVTVSTSPWLVRLESGTVTLAHPDIDSPASRLIAGVGTLLLSQGTVRVEREPNHEGFTLMVGNGAIASYEGPQGRIALVPGEILTVIDGSPSTKPSAQPSRNEVEAGTTPSITVNSPDSSATGGVVHGKVRAPSGDPITDFELALLPLTPGHQYAQALRQEVQDANGQFQWQDIKPGNYQLFVQANGYAIGKFGAFKVDHNSTLPAFDITLERGGIIQGFVLDAVTGMPIGNALVMADQDAPQSFLPHQDADEFLWLPTSVRTRPNGSFELPNITTGKHKLRCSATNFAPQWSNQTFEVKDLETLSGCDFELKCGGTIKGRVSRDDGTPWAQVRLVVAEITQPAHPQMNLAFATTDENGAYRAANLPEGNAYVVLSQPNSRAEPRVKPTTVRDGEVITIDFLSDLTKIRTRGQLLDSEGTPRAYVDIALIPRSFKEGSTASSKLLASSTSGDGTFAFDAVTPGAYALFIAIDHGHIQHIADIDVSADDQRTGDQQTRVIRSGRCIIRGKVSDGRNGEAWPSASVTLWKIDTDNSTPRFAGSRASDSSGNYQITDIVPGRYRVTAYSDGELGYETSHEIEVGDHIPEASVDFQLLAGGNVTVTVVNEDDQPVPFAEIAFLDKLNIEHSVSTNSVTDKEGRFEAQGLRAEPFTVTVYRSGYESKQVPFVCTAGSNAELRIQLTHKRDNQEESKK